MEVQPCFCFVRSFVPFSHPSQHAAVLARGKYTRLPRWHYADGGVSDSNMKGVILSSPAS